MERTKRSLIYKLVVQIYFTLYGHKFIKEILSRMKESNINVLEFQGERGLPTGEKTIIRKEYFGKEYAFMQANIEQIPDVSYINTNNVDGLIAISESINKKIENIEKISILEHIRALDLNSYTYEDLSHLSCLRKLEYLKIHGSADKEIPFSSLPLLWCIYLNYNKKNCKSIFQCKNLEYIFIDNYSGTTSNEFVSFGEARRIGLMKSKLSEFNALQNMPHLEHIGIGYNSKMESISWLKDNKSLTSVAFQNCKKIKDWEILGSLTNMERLTIDSCGELPSIAFLLHLTNLKEIRMIGSTSVRDCKVRDIMSIPHLKSFFIPVKKEYDITLQDITLFNNKL